MRATLIAVPLLLLLGAAGAAGVTGCAGDRATGGGAGDGSAGEQPGAPAGALPAGRTFVSTGVTQAGTAKPLVTGTTIRLRILEGGRIAVQAGCNTAEGAARLEAGTLVVDDLATTEIGCEDALHQQDEWITGFFRGRPAWRLDGDNLVLTGKDIELKMVDNAKDQGAARPLVGTRWTVDTLVTAGASSSVPAGTAAFVTFGPDGTVTGSTGCNSFGGTATVDGHKITFGELVMTKMACDGAAGDLEAHVLRVFDQKPLTYRIEGSTLVLEAPDGEGLNLVG
jgi:heat shock protein HslJ